MTSTAEKEAFEECVRQRQKVLEAQMERFRTAQAFAIDERTAEYYSCSTNSIPHDDAVPLIARYGTANLLLLDYLPNLDQNHLHLQQP